MEIAHQIQPCLLSNIHGFFSEKRMAVATRILLVEDESAIRIVASEALRHEGFEVVEARDGDEAARLLDGPDGFDVLFTDVRMPGTLDGVDVAMRLRQRHPATPVLVVSGGAPHLASRLGGLKPPAVFINKPYQLREIVTALNGLTRGRETSAAPDA